MWKKLLLKFLVWAVLFAVVFAGAALLTNRIMNRGMDTNAVERSSPTMQVAYTLFEGRRLNCMQGYRTVLNTSLYRDSLLPVDSEKKVSILLPKQEETHGKLTYQLRDYTGTELIEEGDMTFEGSFENTDDIYSVNIRMDLTRDKEYSFVLLDTETDGSVIRYYTRIKRMEKNYLEVLLDYAQLFSDQAFQSGNGEAGNSLLDKTQLEMNSVIYIPEAEDNLGRVSMGSGYDAITWGSLAPEKVGETYTTLKELDDDSAVICLEYFLCALSPETNDLRYYSASEYFTLKYMSNTGSAELVDYRRYVDQSFTSEDFSPDLNSIALGITSTGTLKFLASDDSEKVVFEADQCLWYYNYNEDELVNIFGEPINVYSDVKNLISDYRIDILGIDDEEVIFSVIGRQNTGVREGYSGIALYRYDIAKNLLMEQMFIESDLSVEALLQEAGKLLLFDKQKNLLYTYMANSITGYQVKTGAKKVICDGVEHDRFLSSYNMKAAAFTKEDQEGVVVVDFEKGEAEEFSTAGKKTVGIGFIGEDFIFGTVSPENIFIAENGKTSYIYDSITIVDSSGKIIKNYQKKGSVIRKATLLNNTIYLSLAEKNLETGELVDIEPDYITCRLDELEMEVKTTTKYDDKMMTKYYITFPNYIYMSGYPDEKIVKVERDVQSLTLQEKGAVDDNEIYIYLAGEIRMVTDTFGEAAGYVTSHTGTAVNCSGEIVYRNRTSLAYNTVAGTFSYVSCKTDEESLLACMQMMLNAAGAKADAKALAKVTTWNDIFLLDTTSSARGLNLTGAELDTAIMYLSEGVPFVTKIKNRYVVVVSYNDEAIRYYDPVNGYESRVYRGDFEDDVDKAGDIFYTFTK